MHDSFLENHLFIYRGFACILHLNGGEDEICRQIESLNLNKDEIIALYRGGAKRHSIQLSEWKQESRKYFNRFFSRRLKDVICVPQHGDVIMKTLEEWCHITQKENRQGALIAQGFEFLKQLKFLKGTIKNFVITENKCYQYMKYLVYHCSENIILYLLKSKDGHITENLEEEMSFCLSNVRLLINLYQDELGNSGIRIVGIVISNVETQNTKLKCKFCNIFVVSVKLFENLSLFQSLWGKISKWLTIAEADLYQSNFESFALFSSKILSLMACTNCPYLPNFTKSVTSQIEQVCLLLNPQQMDIVYGPCKFTILRGNFGTGKTIILQKKLENLAKVMQDDEVIYYFNYDRKSNASIGVSRFVKNTCQKEMDKIKIRQNEYGLKLSGIFRLILDEVRSKIKSVHVFIDEYNGEDLIQGEVEMLKENLEKKHFKKSIVLIAVQPIEKVRTEILGNDSVLCKSKGNLFHKLKNLFQIKELTYVMRTTVQINRVIELAQKYLMDKQNEFVHYQAIVKPTRDIKRTTNVCQSKPLETSCYSSGNEFLDALDLRPNTKTRNKVHDKIKLPSAENKSLTISDLRAKNIEDDKVQNKLKSPLPPQYFEKKQIKSEGATGKCYPSTATSGKILLTLDVKAKSNAKTFDLNRKENNPSLMYAVDDLDLAFKQAAKIEVNNDQNANKLKTTSSYIFTSESEIGHYIESSNPILVLPHQFIGNFKNMISYAAVLDSLDVGRQRTVIIHFEQTSPSILIKALESISLTVLNNVQEYMNRKGNITLSVNFQYVRGMEFENVIIVADPDEYFLKHYFPEALARCTKNLALIMLENKKRKKKEETVKGVIELIDQMQPPVTEKWIIEECKKCKTGSNFYCYNKDRTMTRLGINVLSDKFRKMEKDFTPILPAERRGKMGVADAEDM